MYAAHVPAGDGPFPTIYLLHGWGASAHDLLGLAPYLHGGRALVLCPQGPVEVPIGPGPGAQGYGWFPISGGAPPDPRAFADAMTTLRGFMDKVADVYPVDRRHQVVMGFSQGGVMAYDLVLREPERFAALIAMSSWLPNDLANAIPPSEAHENLPTLVIHGSQDPMIPVQRAHESVERLRGMGVSPTYREYEMEHGIGPDALRDLTAWLEDKVLNVIQLV
ncbi:MAG: alpha/beta hydrolase-fold protein [Proteobacteria bacterium]|nr:alpha/beta hydrolase-fold protein [Pseudomonadota bacterium]